ncbi:MAG: N-acetyl-gamma-glutamyl-phosphate reductase [Actinomycetota bacterium]|nr:N-acetyl-gamma-glutamyl-phosphate reductase [Actinomycetota bacterium]MDK1016099.1 N-acetyl-gamma-glutamyl-phosphate reductase [Actinomycetota bacterium]MDK1025830.1 N-acetyl-gamma-glutamyl-phosphate reductase [Actinomycetota bacterium]MDK1038260.1 N-acetyl-gamma-glutamyl-phosphate reductase [Actinomycetota bacterium]MDK1097014.1 N-acetyl-gamma-glutamyl-phosphate reductase [Actinomycetota bacterium]
MYSVAILGASGYAGGELIRFIDGHPDFEAVFLGADRRAGEPLSVVHPHLRGGDRLLRTTDIAAVAEADLVFMALPHGASARPAMDLAEGPAKIVDLGSDFRLDTPARYLEAYNREHPYPSQLTEWIYGIPELFRGEVAAADRVASPGCYPTSVIIPLAPLLSEGLVEPSGIIVTSMSGVSGAGRGATDSLSFGVIDESVKAYQVLTHRHRPEMESCLDDFADEPTSVLFTPHLVPMQRGILSTIYADATQGTTIENLTAAFDTAYGESSFVRRLDESPETRWVVGSNNLFASIHFDERSGTVVIVSAIDNLVKGAAGQAVQNANLMFGFDEVAGLPVDGWMP